MQSTSQSAPSSSGSSHRVADIVGTAIALVTLTLPMFVIAHYSSNRMPNHLQTFTHTLQTAQE